jgi:Domain of unknown function (DUF4397)
MQLSRLHPAFHLASRTRRLTALAVLATVLTGCGSITGSQPFTQVRVIDASPDAPALDIYQNSSIGLYNIGFGTVSSYIPVAPGTYTHSAFTAGTQQQLAQIRGSFSTGTQYTVLTGNIAANLQMTVLRDQSIPAPAGQVALRFLGQATRAGAVDLYLMVPGSSLAGVAPIATGINFGANTGYLSAPSGTYSIVALPSGSRNLAAPAYTGSQVSYPGGAARTVVLIDNFAPAPPQQPAASTPSLQLITANDYDPAAS